MGVVPTRIHDDVGYVASLIVHQTVTAARHQLRMRLSQVRKGIATKSAKLELSRTLSSPGGIVPGQVLAYAFDPGS